MNARLSDRIKMIPKHIQEEGVANFFTRQTVAALLTILAVLLTPLKKGTDRDPFYQLFGKFIASVNESPKPELLEIGSRNVTGVVWRDAFHSSVSYTGLDIHQGENVDVVGDVHALSSHLPTEHYDAVFSISVFEHLAMPWKAVIEINKILKPGGLLYVSTHPAIPPHEMPWDFWRYSIETFKTLLNERTGFLIIESIEGTPGRIISLSRDRTTSKVHLAPINQSIAVLARKTALPDPGLSWDIPITNILQTDYPRHQTIY